MRSITQGITAFFFSLFFVFPAQAKPVAVTLYPHAAMVTERAKLNLTLEDGLSTARITLPAHADTSSLRIEADPALGLTPIDTFVQSNHRADKAKLQDLKTKIDRLKKDIQMLDNKEKAHLQAVEYWKGLINNKGENAPNAAEAKAMAQSMFAGISEHLSGAADIKLQKEKKKKELTPLEREYRQLTGYTNVEHTAKVSFIGKHTPTATIYWTYRLRNAGWVPQYILNARPEKKVVDFTFDAKIWQASGMAWKNVDLTLATAEFRGGLTPAQLPPWNIQPVRIYSKGKFSSKNMETADIMVEEQDGPGAERDEKKENTAPVRRKGQVFDVFVAGKANLESGKQKRISLEKKQWTAVFDYLARPAVTPGAFTRAKLTFERAPKIPQGEASFLLDSALVQKALFSLYSSEKDVFFGADQQVNIKYIPVEAATDKKGLFGTRQAKTWTWKIVVTNNKPSPIHIRLEESMPQKGDNQIEIEENLSGAKKDEDNHTIYWELDVPAGKEKSLEYGYTATWPKGLNIDPGR